jgi:hypothetical protein
MTLESETAPPILDRKAIETLFGVRRRQAIALLHRFDGYQLGRTFVAPRQAVIDFLAPLAASEPLARVRAQKRRVEEFLGEARQSLTLLRIPLPAAKLSEITFAGLPSGIHLLPGQLSIHFAGATELLEKLFALSQALANDFEALESALAGPSHGLTR